MFFGDAVTHVGDVACPTGYQNAFPEKLNSFTPTVNTLESALHLSCSNLCPSRQISLGSSSRKKMVWAIPDFGRSLVSGSRRVSPPCATTVESAAFGAVATLDNIENHARKALPQCQLFPGAGEDHEKK